ncbi:hypothetical protein EZV62_013098 [Acer yangbiense]|uniref:YqgF/RNase H-like domain-containing protein n=1 Tax=Acer yangbiense TaxID=1000413 RepID=A0A5C7HY16_9ROSI|nr:hypothetical protein EZV62_013098 [Acer yangbiense]
MGRSLLSDDSLETFALETMVGAYVRTTVNAVEKHRNLLECTTGYAAVGALAWLASDPNHPSLVANEIQSPYLRTNQTWTENSYSQRIRSRPTLPYLWEILNFSQMEYLKPVDFYKRIFKDILKKEDYLKPGRLLGLDVSDKYVSLAVSDWKNLTAVPLSRALDRQEINMSSMADMIQSLIPEHNLVGFVVGTKHDRCLDAQTQTFIDDLCKTGKGKVKGLKYTFWDCGITSKLALFLCFVLWVPGCLCYGLFNVGLVWLLSCLVLFLFPVVAWIPRRYKQDGKRGLGLNIGGYCTNPSSWMRMDAKNSLT